LSGLQRNARALLEAPDAENSTTRGV